MPREEKPAHGVEHFLRFPRVLRVHAFILTEALTVRVPRERVRWFGHADGSACCCCYRNPSKVRALGERTLW